MTSRKVILGNLDGIEAESPADDSQGGTGGLDGLRAVWWRSDGADDRGDLRIKAFLSVRRNQTRDHLDLAALSEQLGVDRAADILARIDDYYADQHGAGDGVASQLVRQLSDPRPADRSVIGQLSSYRRLRKRWSDWGTVTEILGEVATRMVRP
ncbi:MAG TPA: hypothetical protein VHR65_02460 [Solirubrobacterales bacterium]|nr:hypothetical protein [Solirubrobacterales bacterium]